MIHTPLNISQLVASAELRNQLAAERGVPISDVLAAIELDDDAHFGSAFDNARVAKWRRDQ